MMYNMMMKMMNDPQRYSQWMSNPPPPSSTPTDPAVIEQLEYALDHDDSFSSHYPSNGHTLSFLLESETPPPPPPTTTPTNYISSINNIIMKNHKPYTDRPPSTAVPVPRHSTRPRPKRYEKKDPLQLRKDKRTTQKKQKRNPPPAPRGRPSSSANEMYSNAESFWTYYSETIYKTPLAPFVREYVNEYNSLSKYERTNKVPEADAKVADNVLGLPSTETLKRFSLLKRKQQRRLSLVKAKKGYDLKNIKYPFLFLRSLTSVLLQHQVLYGLRFSLRPTPRASQDRMPFSL